MLFFYYVNGVVQGPVDQNLLESLARQGQITPETLCNLQGEKDWWPLSSQFPHLSPPRIPFAATYQCPVCGTPHPPQFVKKLSSAGWFVAIFGLLFCLVGSLFALLMIKTHQVCPVCRTILDQVKRLPSQTPEAPKPWSSNEKAAAMVAILVLIAFLLFLTQ